jgi:hypothetical protein
VGRKTNEKFMEAYIELDAVCSEKLNVSSGGVTEYVNRLNNARVAPGREEALPKLVRYRTIRNMLSHESGALKRDNGIVKSDIVWVKKFSSGIRKKKDPLSLYLRRARRYLRFRKIRKIFTWISIFLLIAIIGAIVAYFYLNK